MEPGFQLKTSPWLVFQVTSPGANGSMVPNGPFWQATRRETTENGGSVASCRHRGLGRSTLAAYSRTRGVDASATRIVRCGSRQIGFAAGVLHQWRE